MMSSLSNSPRYRTIFAVDVERSTSRPDLVKAELRARIHELFDAALCSAGIRARHRDRFFDRGDGVLALIHPVEQASEVLLLKRAIPTLNQLLTEYNASLPRLGRPEQQLRIRVVVHAGEIHYDAHGCFGEALDVAFRLLDAPPVKKALRAAASPSVLVVSDDIYRSVVRRGYGGIDQDSFRRLVRVQIAGKRHWGWIQEPAESEPAAERQTHQDLMHVPIPGTALSAIYLALERRLAETEEPYDVEAGLAKLKEWMSTDQARL